MRSAKYPEQSPPNIPPKGKRPLVNAHRLEIISKDLNFYSIHSKLFNLKQYKLI
jgi:hypothetical protein